MPALALTLAATLAGVAGCSATPGTPAPTGSGFLDRYVRADGRVARTDQGNDTVSEGQAYGMLIAEAAGEPALARRIWAWTRDHLQRPDGLLSWHADSSGKVLDPQSAADADLLAAWALVRYQGQDAGALHADGRRLAAAVLAHETTTAGGHLVLAAGTWATGQPPSLDPSYWSPQAYAALARATGDPRWRALGTALLPAVQAVTPGGALPPDWATADSGGLRAEPAPSGSPGRVQYGLDAQRLVVWLAAGCTTAQRRQAAAWWPRLSSPAASGAIALSPQGQVLQGGPAPLPLVAAAAAAAAAGDHKDRDRLLGQAAAADAAHPTYYGAAWLALGRLLLTTGSLGC